MVLNQRLNFWCGKAWKHKSVFHAYKNLASLISDAPYFYCVNYNSKDAINCNNSKFLFVAVLKLLKEKKKPLVTHSFISTIFFSMLGFSTIYWVQGVVSHESYLKKSSKIRFIILNFLESLAFGRAEHFIFVSDYMKTYYEKHYPWIEKNSSVHYCNSDIVYNNSKKEDDSYCYIGGTSKWQNLDAVLDMFSHIFNKNNNSKLYIATGDTVGVDLLIKQHSEASKCPNIFIENLINRKDVENFLSSKQFGFLLRDNILVNNVASPIKLAEYLSCDVNVITTDALKSFSKKLTEFDAGYIVNLQQEVYSVDFENVIYRAHNAKKIYDYIYTSNSNSVVVERETSSD